MQLMDPTASAPSRQTVRAQPLADLEGRAIGLLSNSKLNADLFLTEVAKVFEEKHGCRLVTLAHKSNASAPAPTGTLEELVTQCDFMITANGD